MREIEELSRRTAGGPNDIKIAFGADGSWPFYWYLRNYPNAVHYGTEPSREHMDAPVVIAGRDEWDSVAPYLGDDYFVNTYTYLWWPSEDYRDLTWARITRVVTDTEMRGALWDIWYDRDYRRYDELTGKTHTFDQWPLRNEYRLYVRRDVVAQMWDLSTTGPEEVEIVDPYAEGWQDLTAVLVFAGAGPDEGHLLAPRGIKVGPDGDIYVADSGNNRIQRFSADGEFVESWGGFTEPWDVAVAPDGTVYVADTWDHSIARLQMEGAAGTSWGTFGQYGLEDAPGQGVFYGPRGIAVDRAGTVYVADTGNKRIQVFDRDGTFLRQWGGAGVLEGYLDEPVGICFGRDSGVFVADTWNRRIQVFDQDGTFLREWPIHGWDTGFPEEKPYLAVDSRGRVYATDPGHYRVLVFDSRGNYQLSFGKYGDDEASFELPSGIAVGPGGTIYVTDAKNGRVLAFVLPDRLS
jgi:DNA-binding beta-propeller fold protein YncE